MTPTSAGIQPINKPDDEVNCVSLQRLPRCTGVNLNLVKPWLGHGKAKRHQNLFKKSTNLSMYERPDQPSSRQNTKKEHPHTKSGRTVKKPQHYCLQYSFPDGSACMGGGSLKDHKQ